MKHWVIVLALLGTSSGCRKVEAVEHVVYWADRPSIAMMPEFQAVAAGVTAAETVEFMEGLPGPLVEKDVLERELTKKVVRIHDWTFYETPLVLQPQDLELFRTACASPDNFRMISGVKACVGFHPDYAVRWKHGNQTFDLLFCFGCDEAKLYLGELETLYVDIRTRTFVPLLGKYRSQRPEHPPFPF